MPLTGIFVVISSLMHIPDQCNESLEIELDKKIKH
jgi:hypothetical protein